MNGRLRVKRFFGLSAGALCGILVYAGTRAGAPRVPEWKESGERGMKYQGIRKIHEGKFITRYDVDYVTSDSSTANTAWRWRSGSIISRPD